jgi:cytochrome b561
MDTAIAAIVDQSTENNCFNEIKCEVVMQMSNSNTGSYTERRVAERRRNVSNVNFYVPAGASADGNIFPIHAERRNNIPMRELFFRDDLKKANENKISKTESSAAQSVKNSKATMLLHWGTALAIIIGVGAMFVREYIEEKTFRVGLLELHRQLGMVVLAGVAIRLAVRYWVGMAKQAPTSFFARLCAGLCHLTLYALLIALPLLGLAVSNAHNVDLNLFGLGHLPRLVMDDSDLADELTDYHIWASWALLGVLVMHISAALLHHYVLKDNVLNAMLPERKPNKQTAFKKIFERNSN